MKFLIAFSLLFSSMAFAKDYKLSKSEFLSRLDQGTITLEKVPSVAANPELIDRLLTSQKKEFPGFKDEMFYVSYVKSNDFTYFVFYEWYDRGCIYGVTEPKAYSRASSDSSRGTLANNELSSYEKIDKKHCEKVLGVSLPDGGLTRVPGAIKVEKPKKK